MNGCEFIRVVTKDDEECFLLTKLINNGESGFDLTLCHNGKVWTGSVSEEDLDTLSTRLKMDFKKYVSQTVTALTTQSSSKEPFQYQLNKKSAKNSLDFVWKKNVPGEDITLGSVTLESRADSAVLITQIFNHCVESMEELKSRIQRLETDNQRLSQERINALKRLEKCVVAKEEIEHDLYTKFSMVLNSKKEKIRELKQASEAAVTSTKRSRSPESSPSDGECGKEVDNEQPNTKRARGKGQKKETADESLVFEEDEEPAPVTTWPRRQRGKAQKQTPSKPVLPKKGSSELSPGPERRTSLRKSGSSKSNRSSDNLDADDLMEEL